MENVKISIVNSAYSDKIYKRLEGEIQGLFKTKNDIGSKESLADAISDLLSGTSAFLIHPLEEFPLQYPEELVIAALARRQGEQINLLVHKDQKAGPGILQLHPNTELWYYNQNLVELLETLKPDIKTKKVNSRSNLLDAINNGECKCALVSRFYIDFGIDNIEDFEIKSLSTKEIVPLAGSGCIAFICRKDNLPIRRNLKLIHHPGIENETNSERKTLELLPLGQRSMVNIHVTRDKNHYFHISFCYRSKMKKGLIIENFSHSTMVGLADYIVNKIE